MREYEAVGRMESMGHRLGRKQRWRTVAKSALLEQYGRTPVEVLDVDGLNREKTLTVDEFAAANVEFSLGKEALAGISDA